MIRDIKKIFLLILVLISLCIGVTLMLKADIGLGAWDAFVASVSNILNIKIGNSSLIVNGIMFATQLALLRNNFKKTQYLQILVIFLFGTLVNIFLYNIFIFSVENYFIRLILFILGILIVSLSISIMVAIDIVTFPTEGFSKAIEKKYNINFSKVRLSLDIFAILFSLFATFILKKQLYIREGTIICMIIFNFIVSICLKFFKKNNYFK